MAEITIHHIDDDPMARLAALAARHGRSMEEEACSLLQAALSTDSGSTTGAALVADIRAWVASFSGIELELPVREQMRDPPDFSSVDFDR